MVFRLLLSWTLQEEGICFVVVGRWDCGRRWRHYGGSFTACSWRLRRRWRHFGSSFTACSWRLKIFGSSVGK